jgi:hypothetical protein
MPSNEKIAIAAHLHVLLRRKTGRVTDTEWMASNHEYAVEVARFAREKAAEDNHPDLAVWDPRPLHRHRGRGLPRIRFYRVHLRSDLWRQRVAPRTQAPRPKRAALRKKLAVVCSPLSRLTACSRPPPQGGNTCSPAKPVLRCSCLECAGFFCLLLCWRGLWRCGFACAVDAVRQHVARAQAHVLAGFVGEGGHVGWPALSARMLRRTASWAGDAGRGFFVGAEQGGWGWRVGGLRIVHARRQRLHLVTGRCSSG